MGILIYKFFWLTEERMRRKGEEANWAGVPMWVEASCARFHRCEWYRRAGPGGTALHVSQSLAAASWGTREQTAWPGSHVKISLGKKQLDGMNRQQLSGLRVTNICMRVRGAPTVHVCIYVYMYVCVCLLFFFYQWQPFCQVRVYVTSISESSPPGPHQSSSAF